CALPISSNRYTPPLTVAAALIEMGDVTVAPSVGEQTFIPSLEGAEHPLPAHGDIACRLYVGPRAVVRGKDQLVTTRRQRELLVHDAAVAHARQLGAVPVVPHLESVHASTDGCGSINRNRRTHGSALVGRADIYSVAGRSRAPAAAAHGDIPRCVHFGPGAVVRGKGQGVTSRREGERLVHDAAIAHARHFGAAIPYLEAVHAS